MTEALRLPATAGDWQDRGACRDAEPTLFMHHPDGERGPARRRRDTQAVAVCAQCPVIERCRQHAFSVREPFGVWGGLTEPDREAMQQRFSILRVVDPEGNCMATDPIPAIRMPVGS